MIMLLNSFLKLQLVISISVITFMLLIGCQESQVAFKTDDILFDNLIKKDITLFKRYDSLNYENSEYYQNAIGLNQKSANLIEAIKDNTLEEDSISIFNNYLNEVCRQELFSLDYNDLKSMDKSVAIYKVKMFQTIATKLILDIEKNNYYPVALVQPIMVPRKGVINLGEKFLADIYIAGYNYTNKYIAIINGDTVKYSNSEGKPLYEKITTSKGEKTVNGTVQIYHPGLNATFKYDVSSKYTVK